MRTIVHITAGNEDTCLTGEELTEVLHEYMASGRSEWPMQFFRMGVDDGFVITLPRDLEPEYLLGVTAHVRQVLGDPAGGVLVTRPGVIFTRTPLAQLQSHQKGTT